MTNTSTVYICGDSFCIEDPAYGDNWVGLLKKKLPNTNVINLSVPGASNYLIYLQIKEALRCNCDYIIYHATSSIRQEFLIVNDGAKIDSIQRYWHPFQQTTQSMVSTSWLNPDGQTKDAFTNDQIVLIKTFFTELVDLPAMIEKNYIFINHTLAMLSQSQSLKNWIWSRGGFEHKSFNPNVNWDFSNYSQRECLINLWDKYDRHRIRPYYHVTDPSIHENACNQYIKMLQLTNDTN
jgi:hypothetical protein